MLNMFTCCFLSLSFSSCYINEMFVSVTSVFQSAMLQPLHQEFYYRWKLIWDVSIPGRAEAEHPSYCYLPSRPPVHFHSDIPQGGRPLERCKIVYTLADWTKLLQKLLKLPYVVQFGYRTILLCLYAGFNSLNIKLRAYFPSLYKCRQCSEWSGRV